MHDLQLQLGIETELARLDVPDNGVEFLRDALPHDLAVINDDRERDYDLGAGEFRVDFALVVAVDRHAELRELQRGGAGFSRAGDRVKRGWFGLVFQRMFVDGVDHAQHIFRPRERGVEEQENLKRSGGLRGLSGGEGEFAEVLGRRDDAADLRGGKNGRGREQKPGGDG